ncbi:MAG: copper amine oxidase N-terminal domain-containing protein [Oscillospiraceae bacterium]|nr:copper amine oxidase N-terminal domain-containing protein [Oscillospiraceae bacterium]
MKKLISLCLALVLALALTVPASASDASGAVRVQLNGQDVDFPYGAPEIVNGRTMVPMRAMLEALGAKVDYDGGAVSAEVGGISITHVIGTDKIDIAGQDSLTMDAASYIKDGSTMVPLRFFSQALGYEVYWDGGARTAVVIDKKGAVEAIDKSFTILNALQAKQAAALKTSGSTAMDMDFSGEIKLLAPGSGNQALPFSMKMSALYGPDAVNAEGTMDLSALAVLMGGEDAEDAEMLASMLKDLSFKMIYGESMWMQMPTMTALLLGQSGESGVWMKTDAGDMPAVSMMGTETSTIGGALYAMAEFMDADVPVNIYDDLTQAAGLLTTLMGDGTFTKNGGDYSWKLDDAASALLAEATGETNLSLDMAMEVKANGSSTFSMDLKMEDEVAMSLSASSTGTDSTVKGQLQVQDVCSVTFQGGAKMQASGTAPVTAPPAGEMVIDLDALGAASGMDVGVIGGADGPTGIFTAA